MYLILMMWHLCHEVSTVTYGICNKRFYSWIWLRIFFFFQIDFDSTTSNTTTIVAAFAVNALPIMKRHILIVAIDVSKIARQPDLIRWNTTLWKNLQTIVEFKSYKVNALLTHHTQWTNQQQHTQKKRNERTTTTTKEWEK